MIIKDKSIKILKLEDDIKNLKNVQDININIKNDEILNLNKLINELEDNLNNKNLKLNQLEIEKNKQITDMKNQINYIAEGSIEMIDEVRNMIKETNQKIDCMNFDEKQK